MDATGSAKGWLKILPAADLLSQLRADSALDAMWRQSRLAATVWERDLLAAIRRQAEFVQLMPASESHHHAHVGGLLAHTLEMVLAAMTWRNGHFLPSGAQIEQIDDERDVWTYVVFFAALLHDIAKPLTDLRVSWRAAQMPEALRWTPVAGSLVQLAHGRQQAEYLVEFTPKSMRDYGAHSKLALTLLAQIAPPSALSFLARTPQAMDMLTQYLSGADKTSLVATIVRRADQASTQKALLSGSRARFETATSVPLIELLMSAVRAMIKSGTELPLNRSGAAGWVHEGSVWFVAKRLADAVREWLRKNAPEESIPGDSKNDRLFDTWQEYGCIQPNPASGQAIWYVAVHGQVDAAQAGEGGEGSAYSHTLSVLRFPLERLFDGTAHYPPPMAGRIEVKDKRAGKDDEATPAQANGPATTPEAAAEAPTLAQQGAKDPEAAAGSCNPPQAAAEAPKAGSTVKAMRAPGFNKPGKPKPGASALKPKETAAGSPASASPRPAGPPRPATPPGEITLGGSVDGFDVDDDGWLGDEDDVRAAAIKPPPPRTGPSHTGATSSAVRRPAANSSPQAKASVSGRSRAQAHAAPSSAPEPQQATDWPRPEPVAARTVPAEVPTASAPATPARTIAPLIVTPAAAPGPEPAPVVLAARLPELPHAAGARKTEPSATAVAFMQWLQQGLAAQDIKYNESGAPVHFTGEGMALVSPLIFKQYAAETGKPGTADLDGLQVQREVIKAGWHRMTTAKGSGRLNILRYEVVGRGGVAVGKLSAVVLSEPDRWVLPVPPINPVLRLV